MAVVGHTRRAAGLIATICAAALLTAACGSDSDDSTGELSDEPVTLRMTWWGNDVRQANTLEIIDAFEAEHPNITIEPQYTDWTGYWDQLATETAANDAPDIIQMDEKYISTYAGRGALLDLGELSDNLDTADFSEEALATGQVDGALYGLPIGLTSYAVVANPTLIEEAGLTMPDDTTWTWDDFEALTQQTSQAGGGAFYGTQAWGFEDGGLRVWARQRGDSLYDKDGNVSIQPETLASWWEYLRRITDEGAAPPASATVERQTAGLSESFTATNAAAFGNWWNSQLTALSEASGSPLQLLRLPRLPDGEANFAYYKPSMYWSGSARTEHRAEVALFLDFLVNSEEAAEIQLTERGVPANDAIREHITPQLTETDVAVVEFLDDLADEVGEAEAVTPEGGSAIEEMLTQYTEQVLFGQTSPEDAAEGFIEELSAEVENAAS